MLDDFFTRALLGGVGVALAAGPLGCFIVWRRMAFFGDATAHAAVLGVAFALALDVSIMFGVLIVALGMAWAVSTMAGWTHAEDTILGVLSHGALATGLVAVSLQQGPRIDLEAYLLGDILAIGAADLAAIWGGAAIVLGLLGWRWSAVLTATLNPDLAAASGINPRREQLVLTVGLAIVVAVALKVIGALLVGALLLIPAATARGFARTPETMAMLAAGIGAASAIAGLQMSLHFDTPAGPSIVSAAAAAFAVATIAALAWRRLSR